MHYKLKEISKKDAYRSMDWVGLSTFSSGLGLLLLSMTYLGYGLSGYIADFSMLAVGLGLILFFVQFELSQQKIVEGAKVSAPALLDMSLFKIR